VDDKKEPKIVLFDIETLPDLRMAMQHFTELSRYPGLTLKASINSIICFGYKVVGEKETHCISAWDYPSWNKDVNDDARIVEEAYRILSDADAVVTHNGKRFDWKFLQTRILKHGMKPLQDTKHIDTCSLAKSNLLLFNNRLNTLAKTFGVQQKLDNGGWDLWVKVLQRDKKAMETMVKYCKQDVNVLNDVFKVLRPFAKNIPNYNLYGSSPKGTCPNCGGTRLEKSGFITTKTQKRQRYKCKDCGSSCSHPMNSELLR
jgi:DNA polymerase elongation subunit (family B)